ncbi:dTDP-4-amino-4,6-dideoxy-D-galactose acyltransferase [Halanaerobium congolense]|uniref:dTDP-4-amino-4,6-dideoxy-D-galactose acyltransferase n=1 Tax=Halanaerobium congolense TaxID=54121 RepID=A0A4R8GC29_9FIRM|nr:GNAT family N-acetyltransferase [Halanaerobium congolense]TDX42942.1 dTDP-4-amino-4,6-dideoxy-D-galactose acyltransferase [Halanaerobium congolense]
MLNRLKWDSDFWDLEIADLHFENDNFEAEEHNFFDYDIIQSKVEINKKKIINFLESKKFNFINLEISLVRNLSNYNYKRSQFEIAQKKDIDDVCLIASNVFEKSRFDVFERLTNQKISNFYSLWVKKSVLGTFDDCCIIERNDQNKIIGFITLKFLNDDSAEIGLLGVKKNNQGLGIGSKLLSSAYKLLKEKKIERLIVSTQGTNYNALNFYYKNNFKLNKINSWYYKINKFNKDLI